MSQIAPSSLPKLTPDQTREALAKIPQWHIADGELVRAFAFADFIEAMRFVDAVARLAEEAGHHPDIDIRYNKVRLALVSHDAGGITGKDFNLATGINRI